MTLDIFSNGFLEWGLIALAVLALLLFVFVLHRRADKFDFALQRRSRLLTPAEKKFFECLITSLGDDFYIFTKIAMLDAIEASPGASRIDSWQIKRRLSSERLDYVLCKKHDLSIFGVIELENFEKKGDKREIAQREKLVDTVCKAAHLRLFYFDVRQDYQNIDIRRLVTGRSARPKEPLASGAAKSQFTIDDSSYAAFAKHRNCPQCNGEVVTKVAVRGKHIGEKFLMCRKYPYCDYRVMMNKGQMKQKAQQSEARSEREAEKTGYADWSRG
ncbi:MAG: DUF2726 domain-containing protein [Gammaproteobacteria bacterium]|nr:DUF2726 domain-containing protein [Gammaproteobacteria bacterium]